MRLPGVCIVCRRQVYFTVRYRTVNTWRDPGGRRHVCPAERPTCGAWMPLSKERCARSPGHRPDGPQPGRTGHRTQYALDNQYRRNVGRDRAA